MIWEQWPPDVERLHDGGWLSKYGAMEMARQAEDSIRTFTGRRIVIEAGRVVGSLAALGYLDGAEWERKLSRAARHAGHDRGEVNVREGLAVGAARVEGRTARGYSRRAALPDAEALMREQLAGRLGPAEAMTMIENACTEILATVHEPDQLRRIQWRIAAGRHAGALVGLLSVLDVVASPKWARAKVEQAVAESAEESGDFSSFDYDSAFANGVVAAWPAFRDGDEAVWADHIERYKRGG